VPELAIIGGSGMTALEELEAPRRENVSTPYGEPSAPVVCGRLFGREVAFLPRHGHGHHIPPHRINYRANIRALHDIGVRKIVAVAAVGGIDADLRPGRLALPDQIVDYTSSRAHTFFEGTDRNVVHVDFTWPYCSELRGALAAAAGEVGLDVRHGGTYGATQGPRLESAAEIDRMERDGCHMVGMTGMPEAALARELGLSYATCAVVVNAAAGRGPAEIRMEEIQANLAAGMERVRVLLAHALPKL